MNGAPHLELVRPAPATAPAPPSAFAPVTLGDLEPLRLAYTEPLEELDAIERCLGKVSPALREEIRDRIVTIRLLLELGASHVAGIEALVRAHEARAPT